MGSAIAIRRTPLLTSVPAAWIAPALLIFSNVFMTFAWYGHLKYKSAPIWIAVALSWCIAFFEYCLAVPANRLGSSLYTTAELKTIQEVATLAVFAGFSFLYLKEPLSVNHAVGFTLIVAGAFFVFRGPL
ncbi:MAG TPA: DMT family protein [Hyphomicrobiaceae bacterium]|nr:DMT family protein [Hyphomicrobiaceae bacterium]